MDSSVRFFNGLANSDPLLLQGRATNPSPTTSLNQQGVSAKYSSGSQVTQLHLRHPGQLLSLAYTRPRLYPLVRVSFCQSVEIDHVRLRKGCAACRGRKGNRNKSRRRLWILAAGAGDSGPAYVARALASHSATLKAVDRLKGVYIHPW